MRRPAFWGVLALLSVAAAAAAYRAFPQAFAIITLDLSMDRGGALAAARAIAVRDGLGPAGYREAASFALDEETQTFVELEGGGKDAFTTMVRDGLYAAYAWRVRHFKEGEVNETLMQFRPDGRPYGFVETLREDAPGAALDTEAARRIAERDAAANWSIVFADYQLVEHGQETRPGRRVDHTFTYERPSPTLGDGRYRLRLVVSGDRLTEVTPFVRIPEAFSRRYDGMRAANDAIGTGSIVGATLLYGVGGMGVGLFFMLRRRWLVWRPAFAWGAAIALLQTLAVINDWPLQWMTYDTAVPRATFFAQQIALLVAAFFGLTVLFTLSFMTAETLTRRAFGSHPQFWRLWSRGAGGSTAVLGRTAAGYLLVAIFFAYDVVLYLVATRRFGWWSPSEALLHPDVLASYVPWFSAIANSLQAGFWEECVFRAIPLAGAALIGDRFGRRRECLTLAFVIQAAIFGAGHAPYPNQPAFARPVELILPSIGFGLLYLYFGLLPGIVLHFVFDTTWFALPIFVAHAPGIWIQRAMVVAVALTPLWVVLWRRVQAGRWTTLDAGDRNAAWRPPDRGSIVPATLPMSVSGSGGTVSPRAQAVWMVLGAGALVACGVIALARGGGEGGLHLERGEAVAIARRAVESRGFMLSPAWRIIAVPDDGGGAASAQELIEDTAGDARRRDLVGTYLPRPRWMVRIATFEGDVALRAEEWHVYVSDSGEAWPIQHQWPEARPGASLDEAAARALALAAIDARWHLSVPRGNLHEVSAKPQKLAARTDWTFTFVDTTVAPLPQGEPWIVAVVTGDEVSSVGRFLHSPEAWDRAADASATRNGILGLVDGLIPAGLLLSAAIAGLVAWSRRQYAPRLFLAALAMMLLTTVASVANSYPLLFASLSTAQPLSLQIGTLVSVSIIGLGLMATVVALAIGAVPAGLRSTSRLPEGDAVRLGVAAGSLGALLLAAASWCRTPAWASTPDVSAYGNVVPFLASTLDPVSSFLTALAIVWSALVLTRRFAPDRPIGRVAQALFLFVLGFASSGTPIGSHLGGWLAAGAMAGAGLTVVAMGLVAADLTMTPIALGTAAAVGLLMHGARGAFPGAMAGAVGGAIAVILVAWWWFRAVRGPRALRPEALAVHY